MNSDTIDTGGPFIDLGLLKPDKKVTIIVKVVNDSADEVHIDATTRNFNSDDTEIKTFSKPLITGFSRSLKVTFTVPNFNQINFVFGKIDKYK